MTEVAITVRQMLDMMKRIKLWLFELAYVLLCFNQVTRCIVNANHGIV